MSKRAPLSRPRRAPRRLLPKSSHHPPALPALPKPSPPLPCSDLLRLVSQLHLASFALSGPPPRLPVAAVPGKYGEKQSLARHASEVRAIEGYHKATAKLTCSSSVSTNSFSFAKSVSPSPPPKKLIAEPRMYGVSPIRRSYPSYRLKGRNTFVTETASHKQSPSPHLRAASVRSTYGFAATPVPSQVEPTSVVSYSGDYFQGSKDGEGEATYSNGDSYKGNWAEGYRYGYGEFHYASPAVTFKGDWVDDLKHGSGIVVFSNGDTMECIWADDRISDKTAVMTYSRSEARYEGGISKAAKQGDGVMRYRDGSEYHGQWTSDRRHGLGLLVLQDGLFEGMFSHDLASGPGLLHVRNALFLRQDVSATQQVAAIPSEKERLLGDLTDFFQFAYTAVIAAGDIVWRSTSLADLQSRIGPVENSCDGSFLNGVLSGASVVLYGAFGLYEGTLKEGKRSGFGRMTFTNSQSQCLNFTEAEGVYTGKWRNDERHGPGQMRWANGLLYDGEFVRDRRHNVRGVLQLPSGERYEGEWKHNLMHGAGQYYDGKGTTFVGEFTSGHPARTGDLTLPDGSTYKGEVMDMRPCGVGTQVHLNGDRYTGGFQNALRHGQGTMEYSSGARYVGEWRQGMREGSGVFAAMGESYDGLWKGDRQHGAGLLTTADKETFAGTWNQGRAEGRMNIVNHTD